MTETTHPRWTAECAPAMLAYAPPGYPAPDWSGEATVSELYVPDETVGWAVLQGDALTFLSDLGPGALGVGLRDEAEALIREGFATGRPAADVFADVIALAPHLGPAPRSLPDLLEHVRQEWAV